MSYQLPPAPLTALDAVNQMLRSIGQGTINSFDASDSVDAENAKSILVDTTREVQSRGWWFNREYDYPLQVDTEGHLRVPGNCLEFVADTRCEFLVQRGDRFYDRTNHTDAFDPGKEFRGKIVWHLPFDDLPYTARQYIGRRAGREFQVGAVGSDLLYRFTKEMEDEALAELTREHLRVERPNAIVDNPRVLATAASFRTRR